MTRLQGWPASQPQSISCSRKTHATRFARISTTINTYQKLLWQFAMQASVSRKGNCWGSLKTELVHHRGFATREQAERGFAEYLEIFQNHIRKQA
ncbi:MAG: IS3 family transposase [Sterolibacteriaceae bacterium]|uniref:IS3 family transposase n=1 Tax=Candidatus Methylophosphatis roskildensis TaxID=2899263 RepID=A0A9D7HKI4_9PROT|nr:IS3 family transposase [Candidatus Methylophosphatis roskildensis]